MYHIVFIHSSTVGHLGYLHVLTIVNRAIAQNVGVTVIFQTVFSQDVCPGVGMQGHIVCAACFYIEKLKDIRPMMF